MKSRRFATKCSLLRQLQVCFSAPVIGGLVVVLSGLEAPARDILRGGAGAGAAGAANPGAPAGGAGTPAASDAARAVSRDILRRNAETLDSMRAMQAAARAAAATGPTNLGTHPANPALTLPDVPNGLVTGGLMPTGGSEAPTAWYGAALPTQETAAGQTTVTIRQTEQQALLGWDTFNIGRDTTLAFDQSAAGSSPGQWIAFNKINDPSGNPTQILGSIKADGQVYVINRNGVIFGGSSQVNARGLTVSSLPINDNLVERGILNNPDAQFLFSALNLPAGINGTPAFAPEPPVAPNGRYGDVTVRAGAILESPTDSANVGGRITLVGPNVTNEGVILTPDGQAILAAGLQVGFDAHASTDPTLRGLDVFVGAVTDPVAGLYAGGVIQNGLVEAPRGSITIAGKDLRNNGALAATTSVAFNGRIDILASYDAISNRATATAAGPLFLIRSSGAVDLGAGSLLSVLPEYASGETTIGTELALRSIVNLQGKTVHLGENSSILAPNGIVSLAAGNWLSTGTVATPAWSFVRQGGQIYLENGAAIQVAGTVDAPASVAQNILQVDLRSAELADSPLQRFGPLRGATIEVDIRVKGDGWVGTPVADVSGFVNLIERPVSQLTVAGGSVSLSAGDSVVLREGSVIDVSGGSIRYEGDYVRTTKLIEGGRLVDIGSASPDIVYEGIHDGSFTVSNEKYGTSAVYPGVIAPGGARYEAGYTEGAAGGSLNITAPSMALDGKLTGLTITGEQQRQAPPASASLGISFTAVDTSYASLPLNSPKPPAVLFVEVPSQPPPAPFGVDGAGNPLALREERVEEVQLPAGLVSLGGFAVFNLFNTDGDITIPEGIRLAAAPGGAITMAGSNITVNGGITAPRGNITLAAYNVPLSTVNRLNNTVGQPLPPADPNRGIFSLGAGAVVSAAGQIVNDVTSPDLAAAPPFAIAGGSIAINAYSAMLATGGLLDVSGGVYVNPRRQVTYGNAGSLAIGAGRDLRVTAVTGGTLALGSTMAGHSGAAAGRLSLAASAIQIGGTTAAPGVTLLADSFFNQGGFAGFSLAGRGLVPAAGGEAVAGLRVDSTARVQPQVMGYTLDATSAAPVLRPILREEGLRTPASISLSAGGVVNPVTSQILVIGTLAVETGAVIQTDAKGSVTLNAEVVALDGSIVTPGGNISITGAARLPSGDPDLLMPTVWIGGQAVMSAAGKMVLVSNPYGLRQGAVDDGGSIFIAGNIVADRAALLDVSGTAGVLDLPPAYSWNGAAGSASYQPVLIESNGGRITMIGAQMLYSDARLVGKAGGTSAIGGSVSVTSGRFAAVGAATNTAQENLIVRQSGFLLLDGFAASGPGKIAVSPSGEALPGIGNFTHSTIADGGFHSLALTGNVSFTGDVSLTVPGALRVASGGVLRADGHASLSAGYLSIGQAFRAPSLPTDTIVLFTSTDESGAVSPFTFPPTHGPGTLALRAGLIDIGTTSLQGIGHAALDATDGEIRGNGTLSMAGTLDLAAGQIHPTTAGAFNIFAYDSTDAGTAKQGAVTITGGGIRQLPFSAGGTLGIFSSVITQGGVLRAPLGTINLGWDGTGAAPATDPIAGATARVPATSSLTLAAGSLTSTSLIDPLGGQPMVLPFGISLDGTTWIDPRGLDITISGPPAQTVNLAATNLVTEEGSGIDIRGGGDLYAYRWVSGNSGTVDILASGTSFAVLPGYAFGYSPFAPFNTDASATLLGGQPGYVNANLRPGDQITLAGSPHLPAGTYTLLPARYALLPGAVLVTPKSTVPAAPVNTADGASLVTGYRSNNLDPARTGATRVEAFEVAPPATFRVRAEYRDLYANTTLRNASLSRGFTPPRLPVDSGRLAFTSTASMALNGGVASGAPASGRGGLIDINSSSDILINTTGAGAGLVLDVDTLNSFGAESLLIGGLRSFTTGGVTVTAVSSRITLDNEGSPLAGKDIIFASRGSITLAEDAAIISLEDDVALDAILLGDAATAGSGNGALVRVSASTGGGVGRRGISPGHPADLTVGARATLVGGGIALDSSAATHLAPSAVLRATDVSLASGQISLALENPGPLLPTDGLILTGGALAGLQASADLLSLRSYSTLDVYGSGTVGSRETARLSLQAGAIRGFNTGADPVVFGASELLLGNAANAVAPAAQPVAATGVLAFDAGTLNLGPNPLRIEGFGDVRLSAAEAILMAGSGSLEAAGGLTLTAPLLTGNNATTYQIGAGGALQVTGASAPDSPAVAPGFGVDLTLRGADMRMDGDIILPGGALTLRATSGDLVVGANAPARINLAGTSRDFIDVTRFTSAGTLHLVADAGSVRLAGSAAVDVSALAGGGDAGTIRVTTPAGGLVIEGTLVGTAGTGAKQGEFALDAAAVANGGLARLDEFLNAGGFTHSRDYRFRSGDVNVDGPATARNYRVAADSGSITVSSVIDASGATGGAIDLKSHGSLTLAAGALLDASGDGFDSAGKGGAITLEAGNARDGVIRADAVLDIRAGSAIDLGVAAHSAESADLGMFTGTLHLRAPRAATNDDMAIATLGGAITGASAIIAEGVKTYDLTGSGTITAAVRNSIALDATAFLGAAGSASAAYSDMLGRLTAAQPRLDLILAPGAELFNRTGSLTLGTNNSTTSEDWNLATLRFGPRSAAGVLTLRAADNLVLFNALSDGFDGGSSLWLSPLVAHNPLLPANAQSWSLRLTAGADLSAASFRAVTPLASLGADSGLLQLGKNAGAATVTGGAGALTSSIIGNLFQVIRTGSGDIDIHAGRNVQLLNPFAAIYTAGTQVANPTMVAAAGDFVVPITARNVNQGNLGAIQQAFTAQYSMAGGNVVIRAGENIERLTRNNSGLIEDSSRQLPNNWLYRRGYVDAAGQAGTIRIGTGLGSTSDPAVSTTWWVDFTNFFQSVGTLGGGNIDLIAGRDVRNIDAVIPTNARTARGTAATAAFVELGGGDLRVTTGNDISGGIYYVERGKGVLNAAGAITTNATRSPSPGLVGNLNNPAAARLDPLTWLPTTLFVGKSSFDLTAGGDLLLGPVSNPFLLPQGVNNKFWYKTYFSTVAADSAVTALSLGGTLTYRNAVSLPNLSQALPMLRAWHETQLLLAGGPSTIAWFQPWVRLNETSMTPFAPVWPLSAASAFLTSLNGGLNLVGDLTTFPSASGQLELLAAGPVNALQPIGYSNIGGGRTARIWSAAMFNLSDADPLAVPAPRRPLTSVNPTPTGATLNSDTAPNFMRSLAALFTESGSFTGANAVLQTKQARHTAAGLHGLDPRPLRIYALDGGISGLTLFSGKQSRITAAGDISDIAFYLQNNNSWDISVVSTAGNIGAYNSASPLRVASLAAGNALVAGQSPLAGDIQIAGPGTLQVFAAHSLDLGTGSPAPDGTGTGITSIGNLRNPYLPEEGADLIVGAGIGPTVSLPASSLDFESFIKDFVLTPEGLQMIEEIAPGTDFASLTPNEQSMLALEVFYQVLRDTGRAFNDPSSPGYRNYDSGFAAIGSLFPETINWDGRIFTQGRDIRTRSGGDIRIFAPGGGLAMADTTIGNPLTPPGIVTESGGSISLFSNDSVRIGIGRIFTLKGGDIVIWSSEGDIAAGSSSRTVSAAPPTRVVVDPQSAAVETDLAGLATGGGIGVLATVEGVEPGDVDLIAPAGIIDAGDAGIRVSGNINLAAVTVVNAGNIAAGGTSAGAPSAGVSAPAVSTVTSAASAAAASTATAPTPAEEQRTAAPPSAGEETPSVYTVEVIGYGGGSADEEDEEDEAEDNSGDSDGGVETQE